MSFLCPAMGERGVFSCSDCLLEGRHLPWYQGFGVHALFADGVLDFGSSATGGVHFAL